MTGVEQTKSSWFRRFLLLLLVGLVFVGGGGFGLLWLLGFPLKFSSSFAGILAFEAICLLWLGMQIKDSVRRGIAQSRFQPDRVRERAWTALVVGLCLLVVERMVLPTGIWYRTVGLLLVASSGLYAVYSWIVAWLLNAEMAGRLKHGFAERWVGRLPSWLVVAFGLVVIVLFDFLGGIFWWYRTYVTPEQRAAVTKRNKLLRSVQLTTIYDRRQRYLGLYTKTESDWSRHYNDPGILKWRVSRLISMAEGKVGKPAWWWRYLPDGHRLKCEPFSIEAFLRVPYYMIKQRRKVGGSTPALQAAKNFLDFGAKRQGLGFLSTVRQKLFSEMPRSYIMCQSFSPEEMMAIYQSIVWAGVGANYGLHRLALYFFAKDVPPDLSWNEAAVVVASLPNPGRLNPWYLQSCREGKCDSQRKARVYKVWLKRIQLLKKKLRKNGISVPSQLPLFRNGMGKLKAISRDWKTHDFHIRNWVAKMMPPTVKHWKGGSRVQLFYDRNLVTGLPGKPGLVQAVASTIESYREQLDELQLSFALIDSRSGQIAAQYGGDGHLDMALAPKPVVGSMFKVITLMVGDFWPDELPLLNKGRYGGHRRRFFYHPTRRFRGHVIRNSHSMPAYVKKTDALRISANIGFVFFSLRWTWLLPPLKWMELLRIGLEQLYIDKLKFKPQAASAKVKSLMGAPKTLRIALIRHFGYSRYLRNLRQEAAFEAAKAATIKALLSDVTVKKEHLTDLLAADMTDDLETLPEKIKQVLLAQRKVYQQRFQAGGLTLEILSWCRELRMEMGLRYLIHLAETVAGYRRKKDHLKPVLTMTLGVNNTQTHQVAAIAGFVTSGHLRRVSMVRKVDRAGELLFEHKDKIYPMPISTKALEGLRKAMHAVLKGGTARWAGRWVQKKYGDAVLAKSGAKTGTVQRSRGISCVGYLEHRAGAVTLSTPTNEILKTYRIRRSLLRRKKLHEKWYRRWMTRYENSIPGSRRSRRYRRKALSHQAKSAGIEQLLLEAKQSGRRYHQMRKKYKAHYKAAVAARRSARTSYYRARRYRRRARRAARRARRYLRKMNFFKRRLPPVVLPGGKRFVPKTRRDRIHWKRFVYWGSKYKAALHQKREWLRKAREQAVIRSQMKRVRREKMALYRQTLESFRDASMAFHKTHERWTLSSAKACRILFTLLSHWKDWEEKIETPPTFAQGVASPPTQKVPMTTIQVGLSPVIPKPQPTVPSLSPSVRLRPASPKLSPTTPRALAPTLQMKPSLLRMPLGRTVTSPPRKSPLGRTVTSLPRKSPSKLFFKTPSSLSLKTPLKRSSPPTRRSTLKLPSLRLKLLQAPPRMVGEKPTPRR